MDERVYRMFGSQVRALREEKKLTQEELAKAVDLSRTSITNIEQGRQRVLLHQMYEIAAALDADVSQLVRKLEPKAEPPLRDDVAKLVRELQSETSNGT